MKNRTILITGCSSGIGRHCAIALKQRGWRVFATARNDADLAGLKTEGLEPVYLDYTEPDSIAACADHVLEATGGKLYALFNNGAYGQPGAVEDLSMETLRAQFEANFFGWHDLTIRLLPSMRANGEGRIVQCSSVLGLIAVRFRGAYTASKFALEGLTDSLRMELHKSGVHVSLIEPGPIESRFQETGLRHFKAAIDIENSPHQSTYQQTVTRLEGAATSPLSRLGPDAVFVKLLRALESPRPRGHYYVTSSTWMAAFGRRFLTARNFERILRRQSG